MGKGGKRKAGGSNRLGVPVPSRRRLQRHVIMLCVRAGDGEWTGGGYGSGGGAGDEYVLVRQSLKLLKEHFFPFIFFLLFSTLTRKTVNVKSHIRFTVTLILRLIPDRHIFVLPSPRSSITTTKKKKKIIFLCCVPGVASLRKRVKQGTRADEGVPRA